MGDVIDPDDVDQVARWLASDDGQAARSHVVAGRPIFYQDESHQILVEHPDGRIEPVADVWRENGRMTIRYPDGRTETI